MKFYFLLLPLVVSSMLSVAQNQISFENHSKAVGLYNQAQNTLENNNVTLAVQQLNSSFQCDTTIRDAYLLYYNIGSNKEYRHTAIEHLKRAKTIFLEDDEILFYLAKLYQKENQFDLAIHEYSLAINYAKKNGEDFPLVGKYFSSRGACYLYKQEYHKALKDFDYALTFDQFSGGIYANRGITLYKLNEKKEACASWQKAKEQGELSVEQYLEKYCE